jgi:hypothetical protein
MKQNFLRFVVALSVVIAAPVSAGGFKLVLSGQTATVLKSDLKVTPPQDWNRLGSRIGRNAESWTLDGLTLNDLTFYGGILDNTTLFRAADKKNKPLPNFSKTMLAPDIAQLFESSYRIANETSLMSIDKIEPAKFSGQTGFRFTYNFTIQNEEVKRIGEARGAIVNGKLYMITFEAPSIYYYDRDIESFRKIADSAVIGSLPKK